MLVHVRVRASTGRLRADLLGHTADLEVLAHVVLLAPHDVARLSRPLARRIAARLGRLAPDGSLEAI